VRQLGRELALPEELVSRHPFPGPGLAVRILGEVTAERVAVLRRPTRSSSRSSARAAGTRIWQAFACCCRSSSVGVMGTSAPTRTSCALRAVDPLDFMTADWSPLPAELLGRVQPDRQRGAGVNRVVYDVTSKPPGTIEWE
jgi:GMP synthase (glutamine-hydrolysing)